MKKYFSKIVAAYVLGKIDNDPEVDKFKNTGLDKLSESDLEKLINIGIEKKYKMNKFKRTMGLARVDKVIGILKSIKPDSILDIGSGRGTFLWPLLDIFPYMNVTCIDIDEIRVSDINLINKSGISNLKAQKMDVMNMDFPDSSYDIVTALEVLEHVEKPEKALSEILRVARDFIIVSVPSKPDDNPGHIHLFDEGKLTAMILNLNVKKVNFC